MFILGRPRSSQAQEVPRVNWRASIASGLRFLAPLRGQLAVDIVSGRRLTKTGALNPAAALNGVYPTFASGQYIDVPFDLAGISGTTPVTIAWTQEARATSGYSTILNWRPVGATNSFLVYQSSADVNYYFAAGPRNGGFAQCGVFSVAAGAVTNNRLDRWCLVLPAGTSDASGAVLYRNGVSVARQVAFSANSFGSHTGAIFRIGTYDTAADPWEGLIGNLHIWDRALSSAEQQTWTRNEFCTLEPQRIFIQAVVAGASLPTLSLPTYAPGSLTSVGFRPRVTAS